METITGREFGRKRYKNIGFDGMWLDSFGDPEWNSRWLIYGNSGQGKTEFSCQLAKYMTKFGRVLYASAEQGKSSALQSCFRRNGLTRTSKVILGYNFDFKSFLNDFQKLKKLKVIILDSIDYVQMSKADYVEMNELCKGMMLVFVSWAEGKTPKTQAAKDVLYMVDYKLRVDNYVVKGNNRYSGTAPPYVIWEEEAKKKHGFLNR